MGKSKLTLKIDEEIKEHAKEEFNVSQTVEKHLESLITGPDTKEERIEQINDEIKEHKDAISDHQRQISNLQSEKNVLEKKQKEEAQVSSERHKFYKIAKRNISDNSWDNPKDIPAYWRSKFDESIEELWHLAQNSDASPAEVKKANEKDMESASVRSKRGRSQQ